LEELSAPARQMLSGENSISAIRKFFEDDAPPLKSNEFVEFWKSLSDADKDEFKKADLS
jgi:hypothetical protein